MTDVFATAAIRDRVLTSWTASPARFREDANAEEDLALGGYRDRLIIELAQNAADAAARAELPGRLRLTLRDQSEEGPVLVAANTGAPLTAAGVESLATLRASAKRDDATTAVGRFGVGFAAVLAVTDDPIILSRNGSVRFSREDTAALVGDAPQLADELRRRDGHVPILRLPFEADGEPPDGFETAVLLPLRDEGAADLVRRLLAEVDDALLLALPQLEAVEIDIDGEVRVLEGAFDRWHVQSVADEFTTHERERLLANRPTEERSRPYWSVLWALPHDPRTNVPRTVHAPTPTDEPLSLPALLLATFPLDPTRRHVAEGPLTDRLVEEAATSYAELLRLRAQAGDDVLRLVPTGLPAGALDGRLREAILAQLPTTPILRAAEDDAPLQPRDAVVVEGADRALVGMLAHVIGGLIRATRTDKPALDALGVRRLPLDEVVDQLAAIAESRPPSWWQETYAAMADSVNDPLTRESLGALPVPLADGRVVRGARGLLLPGADLPAEALSTLGPYGLRVVHPDAAHETLERLGAIVASPRALLEDGALRAAVGDSPDADDPEAVAHAVLSIVDAAVRTDFLQPGDLTWLGYLALRDEAGDLTPANALVVPGSEAEAILDPDEVATVAADLVERFGAAALEAAGVARTLGLVTADDVPLDVLPDDLADLADIEDWVAAVAGPGAMAGSVTAVRDLDFVSDDAWPRALALFGANPTLRRALVQPVRVVGASGEVTDVLSYTAWWLRQNVTVAGHADPEADPVLVELLDPAPDWLADLDPEVRRTLGLVRTVADLSAGDAARVLDRLADPDRPVAAATVLRLWAQLGELTAVPDGAPPVVRVLDADGHTVVVDSADAVVVDAPMWLQRTDLGGHVVALGRAADVLGDLLDVPLASEVAAGKLAAEGVPTPVPDLVRALVPGVPETWWEHEELLVDDVEVDWWVTPDSRPHAATPEGLARALAWAADEWPARHLIATALVEPDRAAELLLDGAFDPRD